MVKERKKNACVAVKRGVRVRRNCNVFNLEPIDHLHNLAIWKWFKNVYISFDLKCICVWCLDNWSRILSGKPYLNRGSREYKKYDGRGNSDYPNHRSRKKMVKERKKNACVAVKRGVRVRRNCNVFNLAMENVLKPFFFYFFLSFRLWKSRAVENRRSYRT
jgi:hypothetical protein